MDLAFDNSFDISGYGGKLFKADPIQLGTSWSIPGVKPATPEGKEVEKMVKAMWAKEMETFKKAKEKEYKDILMATERALYATAKKKGGELQGVERKNAEATLLKWLEEEAKGANVMIRNALSTFKGLAEAKMNELWAKVAEAVDKKFKTTLRNAKIVAALKITGLAIVIVAAAALTITASVLGALTAPTGVGLAAGIGLALGGIATIAAAAGKIHSLYSAHWPDHKTAAAAVKTSAEALRDALAYEEKKKLLKTSQGASLGPKEKAKLFFGNTKGKRTDLEAAIKTLSVWTVTMLQDVENGGKAEGAIEQKLQALEKQLAAEKDQKKATELKKLCAAGVKKIFDSRVARENTRLYLRRYTALTNEGTTLLATEDKMTSAVLGSFLARLQELGASKEVETLVAVGKSAAEFMKALIKFKA